MDYNQKLERALALIIACTRRIKRPKDLVILAKSISYAERQMGGLEDVAEAVCLSVQQLKDFLTVEALCPYVKKSVAKRDIDSVDVVKTLSKLPFEKQKVLAAYLVKGEIGSKDVRVITTYSKKFPNKLIEQVIRDYKHSKDTRVYVAQFRLPPRFKKRTALRKRLESIVEKREIRKLEFQKDVGILEVTVLGHKNLRTAVRKEGTTLRKFMSSLVTDLVRSQ